jgi:glycosyltransferase involved in cell wall biosynthesis
VGKSLPYRAGLASLPIIFLVELIGLFGAYRRSAGRTKPVILVQFISLDVLPVYAFRVFTGCRVILYAIGSDILGERRVGQVAFLRWAVGKADRVLCTSRTIAEQIRRLGKVKPHILPSAFVGLDVPNTEQKLFDIVTVGDLSPLKGQSLLIDSSALLKRPARVAIVGDGDLRGDLESRAKKWAVAQVSFLGKLPRAQVLDTLSKSRLYVHTSLREGVPTSVLEAVWTGLPIIVVWSPYVDDLVSLYGFDITVVLERSPEALGAAIDNALRNYDHAAEATRRNKEELRRYTQAWSRNAAALIGGCS